MVRPAVHGAWERRPQRDMLAAGPSDRLTVTVKGRLFCRRLCSAACTAVDHGVQPVAA